MSDALTILALLLLLPVALIDAAFLAEVLLGLFASRPAPLPAGAAPRIAILVPAHDEEASLRAGGGALGTLAGVMRVLMVADNCGDDTAGAGRALGCEVVERGDAARRGKGYALAFGRDRLAADPPQVVIVLDADCDMGIAAAERLARVAQASDRVVQAAYLFRTPADASPKVRISNFAFAVKNLVRQRGARRLGAPAILTGSGMAFPWAMFGALDLATGNVVEDLALGIDLVRRDEPPRFEEHAVVWSDPSSDAGTDTQRARWEGGFLAMARLYGLRLVGEGLARRRWARLWLGVHLLVPPLSLLVVVNMALLAAFAIGAALGMSALPALLATALTALLAMAVLAAWAVEGRRHVPAGVLARIPLYMLGKLLLYARLLSGRQRVAWIRTERAGDAATSAPSTPAPDPEHRSTR